MKVPENGDVGDLEAEVAKARLALWNWNLGLEDEGRSSPEKAGTFWVNVCRTAVRPLEVGGSLYTLVVRWGPHHLHLGERRICATLGNKSQTST